ncbi:hypothetical protein CBR_g36943 [Chara braunii]|uniref:DUF659 domain-containing protein n=1 Tax=Chara braunii TaxID=69332 RepID=A0A388JZE7_CHABU|nr:hypothetical protein CBR_g36943 [Chara braunii]|eukprot:GBG63174.1 hypothetical protein CBR_g36943 [Chara braunii]
MNEVEIVHTLVAGGAKVQPNDKNTKYMLRNYKGGEAESDVHCGHASCGEEGSEDLQTDEPEPPPVAGWAVARIANMLSDALDEAVGVVGAADGGGGEEGQGSTTRMSTLRQTTMRRWVDNAAQKKLDIAWAEAMFRAGVAFNFLNMDTTQTLHAVHLEVANSRLKVKLPSYNYMRTVMLDIIYMKIQKEVNPMTSCRDLTGCTFITDGSTDRMNRPVMNFLAAGEQGAVLMAMVTMSGRKKNVVALAKLWEQVMREIGLQRINTIYTDNGEVNKKAAQILQQRNDVAKIPWVPCGAHCCSLLLKDLANLSWIKGTVKTTNTIVKFIRNHHATHDLMMTVDDLLSLLRPTKVRFGSVYQMLHRLADTEDVLVEMVDGRSAGKWRALRWSWDKLRRRADLVYYRSGHGVEFLLHLHNDPDEEAATRAKEMADRDREIVDRRVTEEEAHRAAIPARKERERRAAQQEKRGGEALKEMDGDVQPAVDKGEQRQGEPTDAAEELQAAVAVYTRRPRPCVEQQVGVEGETTDQHVAIRERGKEQQEEQQAAEDIGTPPFRELNDALHHDNLWKSKAGRKRKAAVEESPKAPRRGPGSPEKER